MNLVNKNILIIGDTITDISVEVEKMGDSAEGLPTYRELSRKTLSGGAANVAKHCLQLGANVCLVDNAPQHRFTFDDGFVDQYGNTNSIPGNWNPKTHTWRFRHEYVIGAPVTKTRFYCNSEKIFKLNELPCDEIIEHMKKSPMRGDWLLSMLESEEETEFGPNVPFIADIVIAADNRHGMFSEASAKSLVEACRKRGLKLLVDSQMSQERPDWWMWNGCDSLFLNDAEYYSGGFPPANRIHHKKGREGSQIFSTGVFNSEYCSGFRVDVVDTVGAGDAYLAAWAVTEDIRIANAWAAISCEQQGTKLPTLRRLHEILA